MSTRSRIGIQRKDGTIESIYCHSDGYLEYNGVILDEHYRNIEKVNHLINLGDLSSLGEHVYPNEDKVHSFDYEERQENVCVAYGRDRGEKGTEKRIDKNFEDFRTMLGDSWCEYLYLFNEEENKWYWSDLYHDSIELKDLDTTIEKLEERNNRRCNECNKQMDKGYCIGDGDEYYCSDTCLYKNYTEKEYQEMYDNDNAYYTEWED